MSKSRLLLVCLCVALVLLCVACGSCADGAIGSDRHEVSVEEAENVLNQAVACVAGRDLDGLCELSGSVLMCKSQWRNLGEWEIAPSEPPEVVDNYLLPTKDLGKGYKSLGGRVLVLKGIDERGQSYRTEFLVFDAGSDGLRATNIIYWSGAGIGETDDQGMGKTPDQPE